MEGAAGFGLLLRELTGTKSFAVSRMEAKKKPECRRSSVRSKPRLLLPRLLSRGLCAVA
jgi:hypothetical protein